MIVEKVIDLVEMRFKWIAKVSNDRRQLESTKVTSIFLCLRIMIDEFV